MRQNVYLQSEPVQPMALADRSFSLELLDILEHAFGDSRLRSSDIARAFGMNERDFTDCFLSSTGTTVAQYLTEYRLIRARHFLRTGAGIADAARLSGFASQKNFTGLFTRRFGTTPSEFGSGLSSF